MKWSDLPFRNEDPCDQVIEFFDDEIVRSQLLEVLNGLSRQGFVDIEHEPLNAEVDETYQEKKYLVQAHRAVCACKRKINYLEVDKC